MYVRVMLTSCSDHFSKVVCALVILISASKKKCADSKTKSYRNASARPCQRTKKAITRKLHLSPIYRRQLAFFSCPPQTSCINEIPVEHQATSTPVTTVQSTNKNESTHLVYIEALRLLQRPAQRNYILRVHSGLDVLHHLAPQQIPRIITKKRLHHNTS